MLGEQLPGDVGDRLDQADRLLEQASTAIDGALVGYAVVIADAPSPGRSVR